MLASEIQQVKKQSASGLADAQLAIHCLESKYGEMDQRNRRLEEMLNALLCSHPCGARCCPARTA